MQSKQKMSQNNQNHLSNSNDQHKNHSIPIANTQQRIQIKKHQRTLPIESINANNLLNEQKNQNNHKDPVDQSQYLLNTKNDDKMINEQYQKVNKNNQVYEMQCQNVQKLKSEQNNTYLNKHLQNKQINKELQNKQQQQNEKSSDQQNYQNQINSPKTNPLTKQISANPLNSFNNNLLTQKIIACNCKKSKCLKMYCQCFSKGYGCKDTCRCMACENTKNGLKDRKVENGKIQDDQKSFQNNSNQKSIKPKEKSCNCKKSFCLKKYCQCFNASQGCSQFCKCEDCKNTGDLQQFRNQKNSQTNPLVNGNYNGSIINQMSSFNNLVQSVNKISNQMINDNQVPKQRKEDVAELKKRQKLDETQIDTKISQILRLVPSENEQNMLDFLAYYLS